MVNLTGIIRKVDELGRVVLPIETRKALGIEESAELELLTDVENGQIVLRKATRECLKCNSPDNLTEIKSGYYLCKSCIENLK